MSDQKDDDEAVHIFDQTNGLLKKFEPVAEQEGSDDETDDERRRGTNPFPPGAGLGGNVGF